MIQEIGPVNPQPTNPNEVKPTPPAEGLNAHSEGGSSDSFQRTLESKMESVGTPHEETSSTAEPADKERIRFESEQYGIGGHFNARG